MSESIGNQFNYLCPKCKTGDKLAVAMSAWAQLSDDGSESVGDHEWDGDSMAHCKCGWTGYVKNFIELPEGQGTVYACDGCDVEFYENQLNEAKDLSERLTPGDVYSDKECPSCGALCFPI